MSKFHILIFIHYSPKHACSGGANFTLSNGRITILFDGTENIAYNRRRKALQGRQKLAEKHRLYITA